MMTHHWWVIRPQEGVILTLWSCSLLRFLMKALLMRVFSRIDLSLWVFSMMGSLFPANFRVGSDEMAVRRFPPPAPRAFSLWKMIHLEDLEYLELFDPFGILEILLTFNWWSFSSITNSIFLFNCSSSTIRSLSCFSRRRVKSKIVSSLKIIRYSEWVAGDTDKTVFKKPWFVTYFVFNFAVKTAACDDGSELLDSTRR